MGQNRLLATWTVAVALTACGCANEQPLAQVKGIVRLDGKPLPGMRVTFVPDLPATVEAPGSHGTTDDQGRYALTCDDQRPGAVAGPHKVIVEDPNHGAVARRKGDGDEAETIPVKPPIVPAIYSKLAATPLKFDVRPGEQSIDIELIEKR